MASDLPGSEFLQVERVRLLRTLQDKLHCTPIGRVSWACLWLSDFDKLHSLVHGDTLAWAALRAVEIDSNIVQKWTHRRHAASTPSITLPRPSNLQEPVVRPPSLIRQFTSAEHIPEQTRRCDNDARAKTWPSSCRQRDSQRCVLTNGGHPVEVAHIYPFSLRDEDNYIPTVGRSFWRTLSLFWSEDRVRAWHAAAFSQGTEVCDNLISLSPNAHTFWSRCYFALRPIELSEDRTRLVVQFFWLPSNHYSPNIGLMKIPFIPHDADQGPFDAKLFDVYTNRLITSGQRIWMPTDDPEKRPLPDYDLLEMQWFLHRMAALSGAVVGSEPVDDPYYLSWVSDSDPEEELERENAGQTMIDLRYSGENLYSGDSFNQPRSPPTTTVGQFETERSNDGFY